MRFALFLYSLLVGAVCFALPLEKPANVETVSYCDLVSRSDTFAGKMVRVRALYQTDFEESALTSPSRNFRFLRTWVTFEKFWQSRTNWRWRRAINPAKWRVQLDVVLVGQFKVGKFGHMDMYPEELEVYKVESVRPLGSFRPLP